jgi:ribosomal protein L37AE/L43A
MKHYCGGQVIYRPEESIWYCQRCGEVFPSLDDLHTSNQSYEQYEKDEIGGDEE